MLSKSEVFNETLYNEYLKSVTKPIIHNISKIILFLESKGFNISHISDNKLSTYKYNSGFYYLSLYYENIPN